MSPFFTRTGDNGTTGLLGNKRVDKSDLQIEVLGSMDELSAAIGLARSLCDQPLNDELKEIQIKISEMMSEIAAIGGDSQRFNINGEEMVTSLETLIEKYSAQTQIPSEFILPGENPASAAMSIARVTARRAERRLVELGKRKPEPRRILLKYLNRLSSFLYTLEIYTINNMANRTTFLINKKAQ